MNKDLTVQCDSGIINIRVGAIILKDGKLLMVGRKENDYLYSVGGRIKFGETAEQAVVREVFEETGVKLEIDRLGFVHENYFLGNAKLGTKKLIYEIAFFFYMKVPNDFELKSNMFTDDSGKEYLKWISLDDEQKIYPVFFKTELKNPVNEVRHFVTDERVIGSIVKVTIDRPLGSRHPKHSDIVYPINYGYIDGVIAPDGEEQDAYVLGVSEALKEFTGKVIAIIHRNNDVEEKWVVAPVGLDFTDEEISEQVCFQEQYFDHYIMR